MIKNVLNEIRGAVVSTLLLISIAALFSECTDDKGFETTDLGTIKGKVIDEDQTALGGLTVVISGIKQEDITTTTNADGVYSVENVPIGLRSVKFSKEGYRTISKSVNALSFVDNIAIVDAEMGIANATISGTVVDDKNGGIPLAEVKVKVGSLSAITDENGEFSVPYLTIGSYDVIFEYSGYKTTTIKLTSNDFNADGLAVISTGLGGDELLPGLTVRDLKRADKWYYNEYRGGRNAVSYPHWDWSTNYMATLNFVGAWEEQNEGTTLQIQNSEDKQSNPPNLNVFDSFVYGSKLITAENKIMSINCRTHNASDDAPAYYGVQVIDLNTINPQAILIKGVQTLASGDYVDVSFDLTDYVGKEVVIVVGLFRAQTGDYWKQFVIRTIRFAEDIVRDYGWLPGNPVLGLEGWELPLYVVKTTMPQMRSKFTGISPVSASRDNYVDAYKSWRDVDHIASQWSLVPLRKDPEVAPTEGYVIKTSGGTSEENRQIPEAYLYTKFSIAPNANKLELKCRNFSNDAYTYFKLTAVENSGKITFLSPSENTADSANEESDGFWRFINNKGGVSNPEDYAMFTYDLSMFNDQDVFLIWSIHKGIGGIGEEKLCVYSVELK
ncbi:MAG: carboxypeptidase-like regulatory domain-containing protein [Bacteroidales bacterium]